MVKLPLRVCCPNCGRHLNRVSLSAHRTVQNGQELTPCEKEIRRKANLLRRKASRPKGSGCSVSGMNYEKLVSQVLSSCTWNDYTTSCSDPAGCTSGNDLVLSVASQTPFEIPLELKTKGVDWMQVKLTFNQESATWGVDLGRKSKIPDVCRDLYSAVIQEKKLWNGKVPSFLTGQIMYDAWCAEKSGQFEDEYIALDSDTLIAELYRAKGCKYVQIEGKGLYSTHEDNPLGHDVPIFRCPQRIRIRVKVHSSGTRDSKPAKLSVIASAQPVSLAKLVPSPYSLDNANQFPPCLRKH